MNYKQIRRHMEGMKSFPHWRYGAPWLRLAFDQQSEKIYLTQRSDYQVKDSWETIEDSSMILSPDNTLLLPNGEVSAVILGTFGIAGRFRNRVQAVIRNVYQHECMYDYEAFPGLLLDFRTGKPLNARRTETFTVDSAQKKIVDAKLKTLRTMYLSAARVKGIEVICDHSNVPKSCFDVVARDQIIFNVLENLKASWVDSLSQVMRYFAYRSTHGRADEHMTHEYLFDKMIDFHKSAVYRHFGVTY